MVHLLILSNALNKNVPTSGQTAKRTRSAFQPFRTARRSAEPRRAAGSSVYHQREARLLSMWPSVLRRTTVFKISLLFMLLKHVWLSNVHLHFLSALMIHNVDLTLDNAAIFLKFGISISIALFTDLYIMKSLRISSIVLEIANAFDLNLIN